MTTNRRRFLESAAINAAAIAMMPAAAVAAIPRVASEPPVSEDWNFGWTTRLKGKRAAVFDCTEPENGAGVWRASVWKKQNVDLLKASQSDVVPVIVLRHSAIILAMSQPFWDKYNVGMENKVRDPETGKQTSSNPALNSGDPGLSKQIGNGAVVLACNLALDDCVQLIASREKLGKDEARKLAIESLIPGVILQPSGVFGAIHAQEAGALYIKAS